MICWWLNFNYRARSTKGKVRRRELHAADLAPPINDLLDSDQRTGREEKQRKGPRGSGWDEGEMLAECFRMAWVF